MNVLAHAGGCDELPIFVGVGILAVVMVRRSERRARRRAGAQLFPASEPRVEGAGPPPEAAE